MHAPTTRISLLARLRDAKDVQAWADFVNLYGPLVYAYGRRHGLQDADAADLTQEVLRAVSSGLGGFEHRPAQRSFRGWLFTLAHHKLYDLRQRQRERGSGDTAVQEALENQPAPADQERWDRDYEQAIFAWAAERVRGTVQPTTWQAFWQTAVDGRPGQEVADELGLTLAAVYLAKSRVMARLREEIRLWEQEPEE